MMTPHKRTHRVSNLVDSLRWKMRGVLESDATRPFKFGVRELFQRGEVQKRVDWARWLSEDHPPSVKLDPAVGFLLNPFPTLDLAAVCDLGMSLLNETKASKQTSNAKGFHVNQMLPRERQSSLLSLALNSDLVALAIDYMGVVPVLVDLDFFCSLPSDKPFARSQLYHCDDTSMRMIKFFVYCDQVTDDDGPFELLNATQSKSVRDAVRYRYGGRSYRVSDATMDVQVSASDQQAFLGERGTSFVVDTARCFHRGSRIRKANRHRIVASVQFEHPNSLVLPLRLRNRAPFRHLVSSEMTTLHKAILGAPID